MGLTTETVFIEPNLGILCFWDGSQTVRAYLDCGDDDIPIQWHGLTTILCHNENPTEEEAFMHAMFCAEWYVDEDIYDEWHMDPPDQHEIEMGIATIFSNGRDGGGWGLGPHWGYNFIWDRDRTVVVFHSHRLLENANPVAPFSSFGDFEWLDHEEVLTLDAPMSEDEVRGVCERWLAKKRGERAALVQSRL